MDSEIEELKRAVAQAVEIAKDTNHRVRKMESRARWGTFFHVMYWVAIVAMFVVSYMFVSPYVNQLMSAYAGLQSGVTDVQNTASQTQSFLENTLQSLSGYLPKQ